jgi:3,4-dihydroxy 2-butanone 4-phosphate synthase/GTP cyclohydrolase II
MRTIAKEGRGVIVLIRDTTATVVSDMLLHKGESEEQGPRRLREYGVGAQILLDLGVHDMILMSDTPRQIVGLEGYGLRVVEQRSVDGKKVSTKDTETV